MSWTIHVLENTAHVPVEKRAEVAAAIVENSNAYWADGADTVEEQINVVFWDNAPTHTLLKFDGDDMEHMDYVTENDKICAAIAAAGTTGRICFGDLEGDNAGTFWGVEFIQGHYRSLSGKIVWDHGTSRKGE